MARSLAQQVKALNKRLKTTEQIVKTAANVALNDCGRAARAKTSSLVAKEVKMKTGTVKKQMRVFKSKKQKERNSVLLVMHANKIAKQFDGNPTVTQKLRKTKSGFKPAGLRIGNKTYKDAFMVRERKHGRLIAVSRRDRLIPSVGEKTKSSAERHFRRVSRSVMNERYDRIFNQAFNRRMELFRGRG